MGTAPLFFKEPYRGQFISNGTVEIDAFADGVANETTGGISIDYVFDVEVLENNRITGTCPFRVLGRKISAWHTESGEELYVIDSTGAKIAAQKMTGITDGLGQRIDAKLKTTPAKGKATLVLKTTGYPDHDNDLVMLKKPVMVY